jgi:hypothetical protein
MLELFTISAITGLSAEAYSVIQADFFERMPPTSCPHLLGVANGIAE